MRLARNVAAVLFMLALLVSPAAGEIRGCGPGPEPWCGGLIACEEVQGGCYLATNQQEDDESSAQMLCENYLGDLASECSFSIDAEPSGPCFWFCQIEQPRPQK
jgi:hypothetical protein